MLLQLIVINPENTEHKLLERNPFITISESDTCQRQCCRAARSFTMHITDNAGMVDHFRL